MTLFTKPVIKEYAWSALITFISAFLIAIAPQIGSGTLDQATIFALVVVGVRAGAAALINFIASGLSTISSRPQ